EHRTPGCECLRPTGNPNSRHSLPGRHVIGCPRRAMGGSSYMMASEVVADLLRQNVQLLADGERLCVRAPKGVLTPELKARLTAYKADILASLQSRDCAEKGAALPKVIPDPACRHDRFPLTDIQLAYWVGRGG